MLVIHAFPVHYWDFPAAFTRAWPVGPQKQGSACVMPHKKALSPGSSPKCPNPLTPSSLSPRTTLSSSPRAPACGCHFPSSFTTRCEASCLWSLWKRKRLKSLSTNPHLMPFLGAGHGLCLVLPGWLRNCQPAAHSVSWVCPKSRWVSPGIAYWADIQCLTKAGSLPYCQYEVENI